MDAIALTKLDAMARLFAAEVSAARESCEAKCVAAALLRMERAVFDLRGLALQAAKDYREIARLARARRATQWRESC